MAVAPPARTSQAERRAHTISRLLDAAIDSIVEVGYGGTTMRGVAQRAGVSQGATTHHFPQRVDLIAAAIEELASRRLTELRSAIAELPRPGAARGRAAIDLLRATFAGPLFVAWIRLWIAAAEDDELRERMRPVERRLWQAIRAVAREALPDLADAPDFDARLMVVLSTLRGLGMQEHFDPRRDERRRDPWPTYRASLQGLMSEPTANARRT
jgi:AcrR family transcriptional regulator